MFPELVSTTKTAFGADATSHLVAMPAVVKAGDILICAIALDGNTTFTTPSGWTSEQQQEQSTAVRIAGFAKIAVGTEGGTTVDFVSAAVEEAAAIVYQFRGPIWNAAQINSHFDGGAPNGTTSTTPDNGNFNTTLHLLHCDHLRIVMCGADAGPAVTGTPANARGNDSQISSANAGSVTVMSAWAYKQRDLAWNPDAFTIASSQVWACVQIAVCGDASKNARGN